MEIEGMIVQVLEPVSGQSQRTGNTWKKREYVLETNTGGQYPRKVKFDVWGDKSDTMLFEPGKYYSISVDIESREFNGRWYTDVKCYSSRPIEGGVVNMGQPQGPSFQNPVAPTNPFAQSQPAQPVQNPFAGQQPDFAPTDSSEDLPF